MIKVATKFHVYDSMVMCTDLLTQQPKRLGCQQLKLFLKFFEQVNRMDNHRPPHKALLRRLSGTRLRGHQKQRWMDNIRHDPTNTRLDLTSVTRLTQDHIHWRFMLRLSRHVHALHILAQPFNPPPWRFKIIMWIQSDPTAFLKIEY